MSYATTKPRPGAQVDRSHPLARDLVAAWEFTEGAGVVSANAVTPELLQRVGTTTWGPGSPGVVTVLDGSGVQGWAGTQTVAESTLTLSALVNVTNFGAARTIVGWSTSGLQFRIETTGVLRFIKQQVADIGSGTVALTAGVWTHVAGTYDTAGNFKFYINGRPAGSGTNLQTLTAATGTIGRNGASTAEGFLGAMAFARIRRRVLMQYEIAMEAAEPYAMFRTTARRRTYSVPQGFGTIFSGGIVNATSMVRGVAA